MMYMQDVGKITLFPMELITFAKRMIDFMQITINNKTILISLSSGALCSELAENVQKVTLVGSFNFGSSWHPFGGFT